jgi:hypothetical protein
VTGAGAANVTFMVVATHAGFAYENNIGSQMQTASAQSRPRNCFDMCFGKIMWRKRLSVDY